MAKDEPHHLRIVSSQAEPQGDPAASKTAPRPRKARLRASGATVTLRDYQCSACSEALGYGYRRLVQQRIDAEFWNGKLVGGYLAWCCARCDAVVARIKDYPPAP